MKITFNSIVLFVLIFILNLSCKTEKLRYCQLVNPFIGTGGHGHTYPGATQPFGMVQLSPDTRLEGWDGCSGYHYSDSIIYGFSHTHLSGTGVSDYGDLLLMPGTNKGTFDNGSKSGNGYKSSFSHNDEKAEAGYYAVKLKKNNIRVELTSTARCGFHRYQFPTQSNENHIVIDLEHRDELLDVKLTKTKDNELTGFRISKAWASNQHFYFVLQFSKPIQKIEYKNWDKDAKKYSKAIVYFDKKSPEILCKAGISFVSTEGARKNLEKELNHWDFKKTVEEAQKNWDKALSKIEVESDNRDQKVIFYTALYHTMIIPNIFSDVDGKYRAMDNQIRQTTDSDIYSIFSLWDTFRATHPLYTLIEQKRTVDFVKTFLSHYQYGKKLPVWELAANETDCMIGYHSVSVIWDAYRKGLKNFDANLALEAMLNSANRETGGLKAYRENGFIAMNDNPESVSKTLEYAYDDWCIAQMAKALGKDSIYRQFSERATHYKNLYDPSTGFMRARLNGGWFSPFLPSEVNFNYTEANSWQYSLFVPHDVNGLINLMGSDKVMENYLDSLFTTSSKMAGHEQADITGLIGQYAHGNEPSHHKAYLYNFVGKPMKTQERVRQIMDNFYKNAPDGLSGNEDCGQMSAWYVLSAMGFYSVTPGNGEYIIGSPIFKKVKINFENGKSLVINAKDVSSKNRYITSLTMNGKKIDKSFIAHAELVNGGEMTFTMSSKPSDWAGSKENCPKTEIEKENSIVPVPHFISDANAFSDTMIIKIEAVDKNLKIYFWTGEADALSTAATYKEPIVIKSNTTFYAYCEDASGKKSRTVKAFYPKTDPNIKIELKSKFADRYAAGGNNALIDGLLGGQDYRSGFWQGYQGQNLFFTVDLGSVKKVKTASLICLQDSRSWIWFPKSVKFEISKDGKNFREAGKFENKISDNTTETSVQKMGIKIGRSIRYIRVTAINFGKCPDWHPGAGGDAWIFADELILD